MREDRFLDVRANPVRVRYIAPGNRSVGNLALMEQLKPGDFEVLVADGAEKALDITNPEVTKGSQTFAEIQQLLEQAMLFDHEHMWETFARRMGAQGDLAQAYVIAHEVGHHVQTLLGISQSIREQSRGLRESEANTLSDLQELQADCFAGVWANRADATWGILEPGEVGQALD